MNLPKIVSQAEWLTARRELLSKEKEVTRARDAVNAQRRRLPMVRIDKDYVFSGPDGAVGLLDLFDGRRQLYVHHFMWRYEPDEPCPSCSQAADLSWSPAQLAPLHDYDVTFVAISNARWSRLAQVRQQRGWTFPWYSSYDSDFNYDFHVTMDEAKAPIMLNYRTKEELAGTGSGEEAPRGDLPCNSVFLRDGDSVFHTYSAFARGLDHLYPPYTYVDLTPYGRQESWEDSPEGWPTRD